MTWLKLLWIFPTIPVSDLTYVKAQIKVQNRRHSNRVLVDLFIERSSTIV